MGKITLKTVWGLAKSPELKLTDEELHMLVETHTGKTSMKELNLRETQTMIRVLGRMKESVRRDAGERIPAGKRTGRGNPGTENQRAKIFKLAGELGWDKPARLNGFCRRMFGVDNVCWLDYQQCSKLIEALKAMVQRKEGQDENR